MAVSEPKFYKRVSILLGLFFLIFCKLSAAQMLTQPSHIDLTSASWVNGAREDGTGLYWDIMRAVYEPLGIKVENNISDYAHSITLVKQAKKDAWLGSYLDEYSEIIYPKWHFDADIVSALYKNSATVQWQGEKSLIGKNVGWIKGYHYEKYIDVKFNIKKFKTRENAIQSLENGQIDFFLEADNELKNELAKNHFDSTKFTTHSLMNLNIFLGFTNNERGKQLADIFDMRFAKLLESGEIKKLYAKWNWPIYPFTQLCSYATSSMVNC